MLEFLKTHLLVDVVGTLVGLAILVSLAWAVRIWWKLPSGLPVDEPTPPGVAPPIGRMTLNKDNSLLNRPRKHVQIWLPMVSINGKMMLWLTLRDT